MAKPAPPSGPAARGAAGQDGPGTDKAELKRLLKLAREEPVHMAFALGADGKALIVLDRRKPPRALEKQLKDEAPGSKGHRFGTAAVSPDTPKLVRFTVNRAASGMARKLVLALKGTGYSKVEIGSEDGAAPEQAESDEPEEAEAGAAAGGAAAGGTAGRGAAAAPVAVGGPGTDNIASGTAQAGPIAPEGAEATKNAAAAPGRAAQEEGARNGTSPDRDAASAGQPGAGEPGAEGPGPAQPSAAGLARTLTGLARRTVAPIGQDSSRRAELGGLATAAQASLKRGDLAQASAQAEELRRALDGPGANGQGEGSPEEGSPGAPGAAPGRRLAELAPRVADAIAANPAGAAALGAAASAARSALTGGDQAGLGRAVAEMEHLLGGASDGVPSGTSRGVPSAAPDEASGAAEAGPAPDATPASPAAGASGASDSVAAEAGPGAARPGSRSPSASAPPDGVAGAAAGGGPASAEPGLSAAPQATPRAAPNGQVFEKGRVAWERVRTKLEGDIEATLKAAAAEYGAEDADVARLRDSVKPVMVALDGSLSETLAQMGKSADAATRGKLAQEARATIARYKTYAEGDPMVAHLDQSPFHPMAIRKTLDAAFTALSRTLPLDAEPGARTAEAGEAGSGTTGRLA